jgi:hypothetical protein
MALTDWNWRLPTDLQDYPWDCSATSTAWCMRTIGLPHTEQDVIEGLGPHRISPSLGLLDASGAGLVTYLAECGIGAENNPDASWSDIIAAAGHQPMVIGGREWCHWVAVRMGTWAIGRVDMDLLALMNPAPGYRGVEQLLDPTMFDVLGPFSAVWFTSW